MGTHKMGAEWFDACSSLVAFCKFSEAEPDRILEFQNILVRLFSMLHAAALGEIEESGDNAYETTRAFNMELIDAGSIDEGSLRALINSEAKVELIFQWIQQLIVYNIRTEVLNIPPPILSRSFQEIATGMVHFHDAMKISTVPFPFPYAQTCDALLLLHWCIVPFICSQWVTRPWFAALFCFIQVFTLWTLNLIAVELENPFGTDPNDIDGEAMQLAMNSALRLLLKSSTKRIPTLDTMGTSQSMLVELAVSEGHMRATSSFNTVLCSIDGDEKFKVSARRRNFRGSDGAQSSIRLTTARNDTSVVERFRPVALGRIRSSGDSTGSVNREGFGRQSAPTYDQDGRVGLVSEAAERIGSQQGHWEPVPNGESVAIAQAVAPERKETDWPIRPDRVDEVGQFSENKLPDVTSNRLVEIFEQIDLIEDPLDGDPDHSDSACREADVLRESSAKK